MALHPLDTLKASAADGATPHGQRAADVLLASLIPDLSKVPAGGLYYGVRDVRSSRLRLAGGALAGGSPRRRSSRRCPPPPPPSVPARLLRAGGRGDDAAASGGGAGRRRRWRRQWRRRRREGRGTGGTARQMAGLRQTAANRPAGSGSTCAFEAWRTGPAPVCERRSHRASAECARPRQSGAARTTASRRSPNAVQRLGATADHELGRRSRPPSSAVQKRPRR